MNIFVELWLGVMNLAGGVIIVVIRRLAALWEVFRKVTTCDILSAKKGGELRHRDVLFIRGRAFQGESNMLVTYGTCLLAVKSDVQTRL